MSKPQIIAVVCMIAWTWSGLQAQQFARPLDPNLPRQAIEALSGRQVQGRPDSDLARQNWDALSRWQTQGVIDINSLKVEAQARVAPEANPNPFGVGLSVLAPTSSGQGPTAGVRVPTSGQGPAVVAGSSVSPVPISRPDPDLHNPYSAGLLDIDPNLRNAYVQYLLAYLDGERQKIDDHRTVILSTNRMGTWVFIAVHVFLAVAVMISLLEFWTAYKTRRVRRTQDEIELSFHKIALKTSMHGTILLVVSLVMYFLFLKFVYTIVLV